MPSPAKKLPATGRTCVCDVVQQIAQPEDVILDQFSIDVLDIGRAFNTANARVETRKQCLSSDSITNRLLDGE